MAHVITIEIEKGFTEDCSVCPFCNDITGYDVCGKPNSFPDCDDFNYETLQIVQKED